MTKNKKLLIAILIVATVGLAGISILISTAIGNRNLQSQTGAQTILSNCDTTTGICTVPTGVCNPAKVYVHFCNELKKDNEKCTSTTPIEVPVSPLAAGKSININDYLNGVSCGTVEMYLELQNSGVNSLGACGTVVKRFATACGGANTPASYPSSFPINNGTGSTSGNTNNTGTTGNTNTGTGSTQLANPQFSINNTYAPSCDTNGDALLTYTISVTNISSVSGTISKVEEQLDSSLVVNSITPININNSGTVSGSKISWVENTTARTYSANQTKTFTYQIRIPKNKLSTFINGTTSTATVTYDTSNTTGNTNTFVLTSRHSCAIPTTNSNTPTPVLPDTAIGEDFKLFIIGIIFIALAALFFRFQIGADIVANILDRKKQK